MNFKNQEKLKAITFSYDDGVVQDIRLIELLNKYNLKATFNLNSKLFSEPGILHINNRSVCQYRLSEKDIKEIYKDHEVAAHTLTHPFLTELSEEEIIHEVETDRKNLSELVGYEVIGFAYPGGGVNNDDRVAEIIKNKTGVKYCRTIKSTFGFDVGENLYRFNPTVHEYDFNRMMALGKEFVELKTDTPKVFYVWGHSYEMDITEDFWQKLEEFFKLISNKDDIFYGTNREVLL